MRPSIIAVVCVCLLAFASAQQLPTTPSSESSGSINMYPCPLIIPAAFLPAIDYMASRILELATSRIPQIDADKKFEQGLTKVFTLLSELGVVPYPLFLQVKDRALGTLAGYLYAASYFLNYHMGVQSRPNPQTGVNSSEQRQFVNSMKKVVKAVDLLLEKVTQLRGGANQAQTFQQPRSGLRRLL